MSGTRLLDRAAPATLVTDLSGDECAARLQARVRSWSPATWGAAPGERPVWGWARGDRFAIRRVYLRYPPDNWRLNNVFGLTAVGRLLPTARGTRVEVRFQRRPPATFWGLCGLFAAAIIVFAGPQEVAAAATLAVPVLAGWFVLLYLLGVLLSRGDAALLLRFLGDVLEADPAGTDGGGCASDASVPP